MHRSSDSYRILNGDVHSVFSYTKENELFERGILNGINNFL